MVGNPEVIRFSRQAARRATILPLFPLRLQSFALLSWTLQINLFSVCSFLPHWLWRVISVFEVEKIILELGTK